MTEPKMLDKPPEFSLILGGPLFNFFRRANLSGHELELAGATEAASWYAKPEGTALHLTIAGYWYAFVSIPIFQFILVRWYFRFFIWFQFLWRVSRLNLRLIAIHPDRTGGLGFLGQSAYAFGPILHFKVWRHTQ